MLIEPERDRIDYGYYGKFWSARQHVMHVLADSKSQQMRDRAMRFVRSVPCPVCHGSGLRPEALAVTFAGRSIAEVNALPLGERWPRAASGRRAGRRRRPRRRRAESGEATEVAVRICADLVARIEVLLDLGLGYLSLGRRSTTLSPGEAQRLRIATQLRSGLFGVVYVLDEPSAGLHPGRRGAAAGRARPAEGVGQLAVRRRARPRRRTASGLGGRHRPGRRRRRRPGPLQRTGAPASRRSRSRSPAATCSAGPSRLDHAPRTPQGWLHLRGVTRHNLRDLSVDVPLCVLTAVTGVSGSGKSTLVTQVLAEVVRRHLGPGPARRRRRRADDAELEVDVEDASGLESFDRLVRVDQRPIGRTPRSNLATYTGLFDAVRKLYAATDEARARGYTAGRFSFNVAEGRCETCQGEGFVAVELLFLPGTYAPCPTCHGARYNAETLEMTYRGRTIADVLAMTVDEAAEFLADVPAAARSLRDAAGGRAGLPAARPAGDRAQRRRGAADQAGHRAAARPARARALPARRADLRSAPGRHRAAPAPAAPAGRRRQHRRRWSSTTST